MLARQDSEMLLGIARDAIARELGLSQAKSVVPHSGPLAAASGAFVTLHREGRLRGCIGYIESPDPLAEVVRAAATKAAVQDPRFSPLSRNEFRSIVIEISVLSTPNRITDVATIEIGRDGLIVELGFARGLLLPQVAIEQRWDRLKFLENTCVKAGLPGDAWMDPACKLYAFQAEVFAEFESHEVAR